MNRTTALRTAAFTGKSLVYICIAIAAILLITSLASCANSQPQPQRSLPGAYYPPIPAPAPQPEPVVLDFGGKHTFSDGVQLSVSPPEPYELSEDDRYYNMCDSSDCPASVTRVRVTITNGSQAAIDPSMTWGNASLNGQPLTSLQFPPGDRLDTTAATLLPGQITTFDELWHLPETGDLVIAYHHPVMTVLDPLIHFRAESFDPGKAGAAAGGEPASEPASDTGESTVVEPEPAQKTTDTTDTSDVGGVPSYEDCQEQALNSSDGVPSQECMDIYGAEGAP